MMRSKIACSILRGGTSKGLYLLEQDLPPAGKERDDLLLRVMGSPDIKQIDGLGGAASVTSKVAMLALSTRPGVDVDYTFAQVSIDKPIVSYAGNCGNISSGVGPFAIESGLVKAQDGETLVRIFNTNTQKLIVEKVCTPNREVCYEGDFAIAGVPGTAAPIQIIVDDPGGSVFGKVLPTGNPVDILLIPEYGELTVSIVDVTNPLVFIKASDIGLSGMELPDDINGDIKLLDLLERIRGVAAQRLGLVDDYHEAKYKTPGVPKMTFVASADDYVSTTGEHIHEEQIDLLGRMMSMQKAHPTYAMTGAMCTAAAAAIPGTVVNQNCKKGADLGRLRIGHPSGILEVGVDVSESESKILRTYGYRTARLLMTGVAFY
ncbi:MAG: PrpF domain-containing protein [Clostridiaceae bacterium]|nr:PrpF domain-containing protein [Clostridiaceae bacterium]